MQIIVDSNDSPEILEIAAAAIHKLHQLKISQAKAAGLPQEPVLAPNCPPVAFVPQKVGQLEAPGAFTPPVNTSSLRSPAPAWSFPFAPPGFVIQQAIPRQNVDRVAAVPSQPYNPWAPRVTDPIAVVRGLGDPRAREFLIARGLDLAEIDLFMSGRSPQVAAHG